MEEEDDNAAQEDDEEEVAEDEDGRNKIQHRSIACSQRLPPARLSEVILPSIPRSTAPADFLVGASLAAAKRSACSFSSSIFWFSSSFISLSIVQRRKLKLKAKRESR